MFADRRAMRTPTPHVTPSVCSAIFSMNHRTVDFRSWWRPRSMLKFRADPSAATHENENEKLHSHAKRVRRPPCQAHPNSTWHARCVWCDFVNESRTVNFRPWWRPRQCTNVEQPWVSVNLRAILAVALRTPALHHAHHANGIVRRSQYALELGSLCCEV